MHLYGQIRFCIDYLYQKREFLLSVSEKFLMFFIKFAQLPSVKFAARDRVVTVFVSRDCPAFTGIVTRNIIAKSIPHPVPAPDQLLEHGGYKKQVTHISYAFRSERSLYLAIIAAARSSAMPLSAKYSMIARPKSTAVPIPLEVMMLSSETALSNTTSAPTSLPSNPG